MDSFDVRDDANGFYFFRRTPEDHGVSYSYRQFIFLHSGNIMWASKKWDYRFGCHINLQLCLPCALDAVGLFGSPNDHLPEFADVNGNAVGLPWTRQMQTGKRHARNRSSPHISLLVLTQRPVSCSNRILCRKLVCQA